jgi:hypothetical protein
MSSRTCFPVAGAPAAGQAENSLATVTVRAPAHRSERSQSGRARFARFLPTSAHLSFAYFTQTTREQSAYLDRQLRMLITQLLKGRGAQERDAGILERRDPRPGDLLAGKGDLAEAGRRCEPACSLARPDRGRAGFQDEKSSALIRPTLLEPTPCALIVLLRLRPARRPPGRKARGGTMWGLGGDDQLPATSALQPYRNADAQLLDLRAQLVPLARRSPFMITLCPSSGLARMLVRLQRGPLPDMG